MSVMRGGAAAAAAWLLVLCIQMDLGAAFYDMGNLISRLQSSNTYSKLQSLPQMTGKATSSMLQKSLQSISQAGAQAGPAASLIAHTANVGSVIGVQNNGPVTNYNAQSQSQVGAASLPQININRELIQRAPSPSPSATYRSKTRRPPKYQISKKNLIALIRKLQKEEKLRQQVRQQALLKKQQPSKRYQKHIVQKTAGNGGSANALVQNNNNINVNTAGNSSANAQIQALHRIIEKLIAERQSAAQQSHSKTPTAPKPSAKPPNAQQPIGPATLTLLNVTHPSSPAKKANEMSNLFGMLKTIVFATNANIHSPVHTQHNAPQNQNSHNKMVLNPPGAQKTTQNPTTSKQRQASTTQGNPETTTPSPITRAPQTGAPQAASNQHQSTKVNINLSNAPNALITVHPQELPTQVPVNPHHAGAQNGQLIGHVGQQQNGVRSYQTQFQNQTIYNNINVNNKPNGQIGIHLHNQNLQGNHNSGGHQTGHQGQLILNHINVNGQSVTNGQFTPNGNTGLPQTFGMSNNPNQGNVGMQLHNQGRGSPVQTFRVINNQIQGNFGNQPNHQGQGSLNTNQNQAIHNTVRMHGSNANANINNNQVQYTNGQMSTSHGPQSTQIHSGNHQGVSFGGLNGQNNVMNAIANGGNGNTQGNMPAMQGAPHSPAYTQNLYNNQPSHGNTGTNVGNFAMQEQPGQQVGSGPGMNPQHMQSQSISNVINSGFANPNVNIHNSQIQKGSGQQQSTSQSQHIGNMVHIDGGQGSQYYHQGQNQGQNGMQNNNLAGGTNNFGPQNGNSQFPQGPSGVNGNQNSLQPQVANVNSQILQVKNNLPAGIPSHNSATSNFQNQNNLPNSVNIFNNQNQMSIGMSPQQASIQNPNSGSANSRSHQNQHIQNNIAIQSVMGGNQVQVRNTQHQVQIDNGVPNNQNQHISNNVYISGGNSQGHQSNVAPGNHPANSNQFAPQAGGGHNQVGSQMGGTGQIPNQNQAMPTSNTQQGNIPGMSNHQPGMQNSGNQHSSQPSYGQQNPMYNGQASPGSHNPQNNQMPVGTGGHSYMSQIQSNNIQLSIGQGQTSQSGINQPSSMIQSQPNIQHGNQNPQVGSGVHQQSPSFTGHGQPNNQPQFGSGGGGQQPNPSYPGHGQPGSQQPPSMGPGGYNPPNPSAINQGQQGSQQPHTGSGGSPQANPSFQGHGQQGSQQPHHGSGGQQQNPSFGNQGQPGGQPSNMGTGGNPSSVGHGQPSNQQPQALFGGSPSSTSFGGQGQPGNQQSHMGPGGQQQPHTGSAGGQPQNPAGHVQHGSQHSNMGASGNPSSGGQGQSGNHHSPMQPGGGSPGIQPMTGGMNGQPFQLVINNNFPKNMMAIHGHGNSASSASNAPGHGMPSSSQSVAGIPMQTVKNNQGYPGNHLSVQGHSNIIHSASGTNNNFNGLPSHPQHSTQAGQGNNHQQPNQSPVGQGANQHHHQPSGGQGAQHQPQQPSGGQGPNQSPHQHSGGQGSHQQPHQQSGGQGAQHQQPHNPSVGQGAQHQQPHIPSGGQGAQHQSQQPFGGHQQPNQPSGGHGAQQYQPQQALVGQGPNQSPHQQSGGQGAHQLPQQQPGGQSTKHQPQSQIGGQGSNQQPHQPSGGQGVQQNHPQQTFGGQGGNQQPVVGQGAQHQPHQPFGGQGANQQPHQQSSGSGTGHQQQQQQQPFNGHGPTQQSHQPGQGGHLHSQQHAGGQGGNQQPHQPSTAQGSQPLGGSTQQFPQQSGGQGSHQQQNQQPFMGQGVNQHPGGQGAHAQPAFGGQSPNHQPHNSPGGQRPQQSQQPFGGHGANQQPHLNLGTATHGQNAPLNRGHSNPHVNNFQAAPLPSPHAPVSNTMQNQHLPNNNGFGNVQPIGQTISTTQTQKLSISKVPNSQMGSGTVIRHSQKSNVSFGNRMASGGQNPVSPTPPSVIHSSIRKRHSGIRKPRSTDIPKQSDPWHTSSIPDILKEPVISYGYMNEPKVTRNTDGVLRTRQNLNTGYGLSQPRRQGQFRMDVKRHNLNSHVQQKRTKLVSEVSFSGIRSKPSSFIHGPGNLVFEESSRRNGAIHYKLKSLPNSPLYHIV